MVECNCVEDEGWVVEDGWIDVEEENEEVGVVSKAFIFSISEENATMYFKRSCVMWSLRDDNKGMGTTPPPATTPIPPLLPALLPAPAPLASKATDATRLRAPY